MNEAAFYDTFGKAATLQSKRRPGGPKAGPRCLQVICSRCHDLVANAQ